MERITTVLNKTIWTATPWYIHFQPLNPSYYRIPDFRDQKQHNTSHEMMVTGKRTIVFILFLFRKKCELKVLDEAKHTSLLFSTSSFHLIASPNARKKNTFTLETTHEKDKPIYSHQFLGSCSVKSHRGCFCTYHKHSVSYNSQRY